MYNLLVYLIPTVFYFQLSMQTFTFHKARLPLELSEENHLEFLKVIFITICDLYYHSAMPP